VNAKYTACEVAEYVIELANKYDDEITQLKLQKLLYYMQGMYLGATGTPLFVDEILAWKHGPVVHTVWQKYRQNKKSPIKAHKKNASIQPFDKRMLDEIYQEYRGFTPQQLVNMTHREKPWKNSDSNDVITEDDLQSYFADCPLTPRMEMVSAMLEGEHIIHDPTAKTYDNLDELFRDLKA
jgi:uncharacterized phage-associated protein